MRQPTRRRTRESSATSARLIARGVPSQRALSPESVSFGVPLRPELHPPATTRAMTSGSPHTDFEHKLPLNLSRLRRSASLKWTDSRGAQKVMLTGAMVLGTADGVPLLVSDPRVSRLHAELELDDRG